MQTPNSRFLTLSLMIACLTACSGHSDANAQSVPDPGARILDCTWGNTVVQAQGILLNNMWNKASAGPGPWRQCLQSRQREGQTDFGWFWEWPTKDGLYAYPELLVGRSPWQPTPTNDARFPRKLGDTRTLQIDYEVESRTNGKKNLAVEFWLTNTPPAEGQQDIRSIKTELMIWSDASDDIGAPTKNPKITVDIDGMTWAVQIKPGWGDGSGGTGNKWTLISYHAMKNTSTIRYDARKFLADAAARGLIDPNDYIWGVELGNEIISGSGSTWIKKFQLLVE